MNLVGLNATYCENCWDSCAENFDRPRSFRLEGPGTAAIGFECAGSDEEVVEIEFDTDEPLDSSAGCINSRGLFVAYCGLTTFTNPEHQSELDAFCNGLD